MKGKQGRKAKNNWVIQNDDTKHRGKGWKLKDPSKRRVATLDRNGKVLGK